MVLLRTALHQYRAHLRYLVVLFSIPFILSIIPSVLSLTFPTLSYLGGLAIFVGALFSLAAGIGLIAARAAGALGENMQETFRRGYPFFIPFLTVVGINLFIALGSYTLLIIPGFVLSVLLSQIIFTLIVDGKKGLSAFLSSWQLVYGRFWQVLGRLALLWIVTILVVSITMLILSLLGFGPAPSLGIRELSDFARVQTPARVLPAALVLAAIKLFVLTPFSILFLFELYQSLKISAEDLPQLTEGSLKKRRTFLIICGIIGVISLLILIIFSRVLFNYAIQALELFGGPNRDFVQALTTLRALSPEQIQIIFTR